jgi:hypothetical protein
MLAPELATLLVPDELAPLVDRARRIQRRRRGRGTMTDTLFSRRSVVDLAELFWANLDGAGEQWPCFFELLAAFRMLGSIAGTLELLCGSEDEPEHATWSIGAEPSDVEALRQRVAESSILPRPFTATLNCAPIVLLADGQLHITDYDSMERSSSGPGSVVDVQPRDSGAPVPRDRGLAA